MKILKIHSSVFNGNGQSSRLADQFLELLRIQNPGAEVAERDLVADPVPHLDAARAGAFFARPEVRTAEQRAVVAYSDQLIAELRHADVLLLGLPMYNFGVPSQLKAWFDHIARAGETFRYTEKGAVGLLRGKRAYVFAARGGRYGSNHSQEQFVRDFLAFIGISEVEFVYAEGLAMGDESRNNSLAAAGTAARRLAAQTRLAA